MNKILGSILVVLLFFISSCNDSLTKVDNDNKTNDELGKISFQIDMANAPSEVVFLAGNISRNGYSSIPFSFTIDDSTQTASAKIDNIPAGEWNLKVDAFNQDSVAIYSGSTNVNVIPGTVTPVNLYLSPTTGSIIINVQWGNDKTLSDLDKYLIGYWDFENNRLDDLSLYKNNGRLFGNASFTTGKKGNAINFSGYNGYVKIPNDSVYSTEEKTISFWIYKNNDFILESEGKSDGEALITKSYNTGIKRDFIVLISSNKPRFHVYGSIGTTSDTIIVTGKTQAISPKTWYHCVLVIGKDYTKFYLNGELTEHNIKPGKSINTSAPILLGKFTSESLISRYLNGRIDEFRIYNKAFDSSEIQLLYNDAL